MKLFGTDGVRGKAGNFITAELAMRLAMAAGIYFRKNSKTNMILLGKDTRRSGYMIETAMVAGLTAVGYNVRQIGPMPTPAIAFLTEDMRCDGGIMISASHNPYHDNGIKFFDSTGFKLDENKEAEIEKYFFDDNLIKEAAKEGMDIGVAKRVDDVIGRYIVHIKSSFPHGRTLRKLRIVLDVANGAAYKVAPTIFSELGAEVIVLSNNPNGKNINENCGALHPQNLALEIKRLRADVGFAFDGDADRLVVVDDNGDIIDGDVLIGIMAKFLKDNDKLKNNLGDKYVLELMREKGANFGGEQSGHIIFGDYAKTGDGILSALQFSAAMLQTGKKASALATLIKPYPQILKNLKVNEKKPLEKIKGLKEFQEKLQNEGFRTLFRYSGTENVIRLLIEGKSERKVEAAICEAENFFIKALNA